MGGKIIIVLFGVFILGLVIYAVNSNVVGKLGSPFGSLFHYNASNWFISASSTPPTHFAPAPVSSNTGNGTAPQAAATTTIPASEIPQGFTLTELSPYFKKITFSGMWAGSYSSYGQISLSSYGLNASDTVDITGWQIKTNRGGIYIPQAIGFYDPSGLAAPVDIFLGQGQYVYLYSSSGPFNLRLNKCIGYLGNSNKFTPLLPENCPFVDQSAISKMGFTGACENYLYSLGSCTVPDLNKAPIPYNDYACRDYIENTFNCKGCFNAHKTDTDFLSNQWWIWMGSTPLDQYHDTVDLFDKNGLLVDQYSY